MIDKNIEDYFERKKYMYDSDDPCFCDKNNSAFPYVVMCFIIAIIINFLFFWE